MPRRHAIAIALVVGLLMGGVASFAPMTFAGTAVDEGQEKEVSPPSKNGGTVNFSESLQSATCRIDCIEEPDITVTGDIDQEDCNNICEAHCGGPCG